MSRNRVAIVCTCVRRTGCFLIVNEIKELHWKSESSTWQKLGLIIICCDSSHIIFPSHHTIPSFLLRMASEELVEKKYSLITRRLQEVLGGDIIKGVLAEGRSPKAYWGAHLVSYLDKEIDSSQEPLQPGVVCCPSSESFPRTHRTCSAHRILCSLDQNCGFS